MFCEIKLGLIVPIPISNPYFHIIPFSLYYQGSMAEWLLLRQVAPGPGVGPGETSTVAFK